MYKLSKKTGFGAELHEAQSVTMPESMNLDQTRAGWQSWAAVGTFLFFLVKGLCWLAAPLVAAWLISE